MRDRQPIDASRLINDWLAKANQAHPDSELLAQACQYAEQLSLNTLSPYTASTLIQGLQMADVLLDIDCDQQTLAAAILYPGVYYQQIPNETLQSKFGRIISKLIVGVERMEAIHSMQRHHTSINQQQLDNMRKMLLAIVDDVRIVLIKLAEQLIILKNLKHCSHAQQQHIAMQCHHLYAPLANRLGIGQLKWQLEDLSFRYLHTEDYFTLSKALNMRRTEREIFISKMIQTLNQILKETDIKDFEVTGRAKHIFSIHKKIKRKRVSIEEIYDASALRILVPTVNDCYAVLSAVHERWPHIAKEFDDYVANPKPNGYQSIHTAIMAEDQHNVEIQIRTFKMHEESELGVAAHWKYKEGNTGKTSYEEKISWLREVMGWQKELSQDEEQNNAYRQIFEDRIYVFTPNGDVFDLIAGATPLDFAYHIHTDIGHRCRGAKVNGKLEPLTHVLRTGDQVEILTQKTAKPSRDWLNAQTGYLKTSNAKAKVRHWFRRQNFQHNLEAGTTIWEKATRQTPLKKQDIQKAVEPLNFKTIDDVLATLGSGHLHISTVLNTIHQADKKPTTKEKDEVQIVSKEEHPNKHTHFTICGVGNLLTQLARCCNPIPGDEIIGYITKGRGISIHKADCHNIQQSIQDKPQRIMPIDWGNAKVNTYAVNLRIEAQDRSGLIRDISSCLSNAKISLLNLNTRVNRADNSALVQLTIEIDDKNALGKTIQQLQQLNDIVSVVRE